MLSSTVSEQEGLRNMKTFMTLKTYITEKKITDKIGQKKPGKNFLLSFPLCKNISGSFFYRHKNQGLFLFSFLSVYQ